MCAGSVRRPDALRRPAAHDLPWRQGEEKAWNVYPLPLAHDGGGWGRSDLVWTRDEPPFLPQPPLVAVPPAFLPLPDAAAPAEEDTSGTRDGEFGRP